MLHLNNALSAWGRDDFTAVLRNEIERLPHSMLPLQQGLRHSSYVSDEPFQAMILRVDESAEQIVVVAMLFYRGIIAGCNCADDPTPIDTLTESCTLEILLDKHDASASFTLLSDEGD
jgi:hypothetical protein